MLVILNMNLISVQYMTYLPVLCGLDLSSCLVIHGVLYFMVEQRINSEV